MAKSSSPLSRIMQRGNKKVGYSASKAALMLHFSESDYKRIAMLISKWLDEAENNSDEPVKPQR